jgi:hypothetical protein
MLKRWQETSHALTWCESTDGARSPRANEVQLRATWLQLDRSSVNQKRGMGQ